MNILNMPQLHCFLIIEFEMTPEMFKKSVIVPLFKGGKKDPLDKRNYRGISLQSILCKIFDKVLLNRIKHLIKSCTQFYKLQGSCCKGISSILSSFVLHETICHNVSNRNTVFVTYFDTQTAFDSVWINGLLYKLYNHGVNGKIWRLIKEGFRDCKACVLSNGVRDYFNVLIGVKQGGILSMLFYACFINDLLINLSLCMLGCSINKMKCGCIAYADDLAISALHQPCMQRMINVSYENSLK